MTPQFYRSTDVQLATIFLFEIIILRKKYSALKKKRKSIKIIIILLFKTTYRTDIKQRSFSITKLNVFSRETILCQFKI